MAVCPVTSVCSWLLRAAVAALIVFLCAARTCAAASDAPPANEGQGDAADAGAKPATSVEADRRTGIFVDASAPGDEAIEEAQETDAEAAKTAKDPEKKDDDKANAGAADEKKGANGEVERPIPPPPIPTAEDLARRRQRAAELQSLGEKFFKFPVTGQTYTRYRLRTGAGERDQDMYEFLSMDFGDKNKHLATGHLDARFSADLDGRRTGLKADIFSDIVDTYRSPVNARLYSAYADFNKIPGVEFLRAGRQWTYETPEILQFDGARLDTQPWFGKHGLTFSFYGGLPVHEFEHTPNGDALFGAAAEARPWKGSRWRLDYIHVDDNLHGEQADSPTTVEHGLDQPAPAGTRRNDLVAVSLWQTFHNPDVRVQGRFSELDGQAREAYARLIYDKADSRLQVAGTYRTWFEQQNRLANEFDQYYETLLGQEPYHNGTLVVSKGWTDKFWMEGGAAVRRLAHVNTEGQFNREFDRFYATFQIRDLPLKGFTYSINGSQWDGRGHAPNTQQLGGDITYAWKREFESSVGTDYALYKYDFFRNMERDQVRTYYVKQRWRPTRWATLDVHYDYERSRSDTFHTLEVTFRFTF
ncbi:MAG: hypothetical protein NTW87_29470 [Planctomycetota bacterium]|nr:hypothetical protein [Planctomycetota bacterium]